MPTGICQQSIVCRARGEAISGLFCFMNYLAPAVTIVADMRSTNILVAAVALVLAGCVDSLSSVSTTAADSAVAPLHIMFVSLFGRSHMIPYLEVLQPIAQRGHDISVVTDTASAAWLQPSYPTYKLQLVPQAVGEAVQPTRDKLMPAMMKPNSDTGALWLEHYTIPVYSILGRYFKELFSNAKPDLLICDVVLDPCFDVAQSLGLKTAISMSRVPDRVSEAPYTTNTMNPYPHSTTQNMTLWQRFHYSCIAQLKSRATQLKPLQAVAKIKRELQIQVSEGPPDVKFAGVLKIINSFVGFESPRPLDPTIQLIGPIRSHTNSTITPDIQSWLDQLADHKTSADKSRSSTTTPSSLPTVPRVIYVAFGTAVDMTGNILSHISGALMAVLDADLADGVIWAVGNIKPERQAQHFPKSMLSDRRVLLLPFAPQKALLAHPAVVLFVSHGGAESAHEAMYEAVPMLVISFIWDQHPNGVRLEELGMARAIRQHLVTFDNLVALLSHMLDPGTAAPYKASAKRMRSLVRALSQTNVATAAGMVEFYAQHGWDHLIPAGASMPWYKANNLDLYLAVGCAVVVCLMVVCVLVLLVYGSLLQLLAAGLSGEQIRSRTSAKAKAA